ncbi:TolC family protein [Chitinophaga pendula]|uniref:TolC family protein n=1 Tax=Chitinophaga TaxID=79328 RepID=UPI000BB06A27|nr:MULTISPECIES: TolC family protein [Chitinophaga]ASZ11133.1 hypothetical protein CK934_09240 [Chitinophaga sp. MD30]UCJ05871.1 TolC family protein [Chitinophaga pendula]
MKNIIRTIIICSALGTHTLHAQDVHAPVPATLQQLVLQSFNNYTRIKALQTQQQIAADRTQISKASRLPDISGTASYSHISPVAKIQLPGSDLVFQPIPADNYNVGVNGRQLLLDFGKSGSAIRKSAAEQDLLSMQTDEAKEQLAYQVATVYLNIAYVNRNIAVQDANIKLLEDTERIVENKLKHGDAIDLDLINTRVKLEGYRNRKTEFQNQFKKQIALLQYLTGIQQQDSINTSFNWPQTITAGNDAFASNMAIKTSQEKEKVATIEVESAKATHTPSLFLDAGTGFKNGYLPEIQKFRYNWNAGVTLAVPIYNGKKDKLKEMIAAKELAVAKLNTQDAVDNLQKDIAQTNADIEANQAKLLTAATLLQQAERALQLAQSRYNNGVITYLDLQNAQTSNLEAQLSKVQYEYQLSISNLELLHLAGNQFWK